MCRAVVGKIELFASATFDVVQGLGQATEIVLLDCGVILRTARELLFTESLGTFGEDKALVVDVFSMLIHFEFVSLFLDVAFFFAKLKLTFVLAIFCPGRKIRETLESE